jgi:hypothetical protein
MDEDPQFSLIGGLIYEDSNKSTSSTTKTWKESSSLSNELEISLIATTYILEIGWDYNHVIDLIFFLNTELNIEKKIHPKQLAIVRAF